MRLGDDDRASVFVLGAGARTPLLPGASVELLPNADVTFLPAFKEYEYNLEAVYVLGDRNGGFYAGGGMAWRNTIFPDKPGRQTKRGHTFVLGLRSMPPRQARFGTEIQLRWILVDKVLKPRVFSFGVNFPLW